MINLDELTLSKGAHSSFEEGACLMEAASYMAGEPWSDRPQRVSPVLGTYGRVLNDSFPDDKRQELKKFIPALLNTAGDGQDEARSYTALDWLVRTHTPAFLDLAGMTDEAQELRSLRRIENQDDARAVEPVISVAAEKVTKAWSVAKSVVLDAASDVASIAAGAVIRAVTGVAAPGAAWDAGKAAARAALMPTVDLLRDSAIELFGRMIDPAQEDRV